MKYNLRDLPAGKGSMHASPLTARLNTEQEWGLDVHGAEGRKEVDRLVRLMDSIELFANPHHVLFGTIPVNGSLETVRVDSQRFEQWLTMKSHEQTQSVASTRAIKDAIRFAMARGALSDVTQMVFNRVGWHDGRIFLDLGTPSGECVEIAKSGWQVLRASPVRFERQSSALPLPLPMHGGSIDRLWAFVNLPDNGSRRLALGFLVAALQAETEAPLLMLYGGAGCAKTTTTEVLQSLFDPRRPSHRGCPKDRDDLIVAASHSYILAFDNMSKVSTDLSDALCVLATGGGFGKRKLYTDSDEHVYDGVRPVIVNGVDNVIPKTDLMDRALVLELPTMPSRKRIHKNQFWSDFHAARPELLGSLCQLVSSSLQQLETTSRDGLQRMTQVAMVNRAVDNAVTLSCGSYDDAFRANRQERHAATLEASLVATLVMAIADRGRWEGTATQLLKVLSRTAKHRSRYLPRSAAVLTNELRSLSGDLRDGGVSVTFEKHVDRLVIIERIKADPIETLVAEDLQAAREDTDSVGGFDDQDDSDDDSEAIYWIGEGSPAARSVDDLPF